MNALAAKYFFKSNEVTQAHDMMALFSKEIDDGKLNVHEM